MKHRNKLLLFTLMGFACCQDVRKENKDPSHAHDIVLTKQDSAMAYQAAHFLQAYGKMEKQSVFTEIDAAKKVEIENDASDITVEGKRIDIKEVLEKAHKDKKKYIVLSDEISKDEMYATDTATLREFHDEYKQKMAQFGMSGNAYVSFDFTQNTASDAAPHHIDVYFNIYELTKDKNVVNAIRDHEAGHSIFLTEVVTQKPVYNFYGHEKKIDPKNFEKCAIEGFCDDVSVAQKDRTPDALVGEFALFGNYPDTPDENIDSLAAQILDHHKKQLEASEVHPPDLYRLSNQMQHAGWTAEDVNKSMSHRAKNKIKGP